MGGSVETHPQHSGLTSAQSFRGHPDSVVGETVLAAHFPAGAGQPVVVIARADAAGAVHDTVAGTPGIASASLVIQYSPSTPVSSLTRVP